MIPIKIVSIESTRVLTLFKESFAAVAEVFEKHAVTLPEGLFTIAVMLQYQFQDKKLSADTMTSIFNAAATFAEELRVNVPTVEEITRRETDENRH